MTAGVTRVTSLLPALGVAHAVVVLVSRLSRAADSAHRQTAGGAGARRPTAAVRRETGGACFVHLVGSLVAGMDTAVKFVNGLFVEGTRPLQIQKLCRKTPLHQTFVFIYFIT